MTHADARQRPLTGVHLGWYGACSLGGVPNESITPVFGGERGLSASWLVPAAAVLGGIGLLLLTGRSALDPHLSWQVRDAGLVWAQRRIHEAG